jgi:hypothetical protein
MGVARADRTAPACLLLRSAADPPYPRFMPSARRFPPPWTIEKHVESLIVRDATGQALGYFLL